MRRLSDKTVETSLRLQEALRNAGITVTSVTRVTFRHGHPATTNVLPVLSAPQLVAMMKKPIK